MQVVHAAQALLEFCLGLFFLNRSAPQRIRSGWGNGRSWLSAPRDKELSVYLISHMKTSPGLFERSGKNRYNFLFSHHCSLKASLKACLKSILPRWLEWHLEQAFLVGNKVNSWESELKICLEPNELIIWKAIFIAIGNHLFCHSEWSEEVMYAGKIELHRGTVETQ